MKQATNTRERRKEAIFTVAFTLFSLFLMLAPSRDLHGVGFVMAITCMFYIPRTIKFLTVKK